ncbi:tetratricopeptide repeat protein [uncultured Selenomonas sp.]|uniref:tetratricopeptide repeat protein n=1 Tax=uncultured Selenomonas sp. TaxID=159275 RepID=UPI0025FD65F6|nr:tetratricopeptide repeat protein [uncultured Selenomonas sp.]
MKTRRTFPALALSVLLGLGAVPVSYTVAPVPSACAAVQTAAEWYQRGSEAQDEEQYEEAVQDYTEAIRLEPSNAKAYAGRGYSYFCIGWYADAAQDAKRADQLAPGSADAVFELLREHGDQ